MSEDQAQTDITTDMKNKSVELRDEIMRRMEDVGVPLATICEDVGLPNGVIYGEGTDPFPGVAVLLEYCAISVLVLPDHLPDHLYFLATPYADGLDHWEHRVSSIEEVIALVRQAMDFRPRTMEPQEKMFETLCFLVGVVPTPEFGANGDFLGFDTRKLGTHQSTGPERAWSGDMWCKPDEPCVECDPPVPAERLRRLMFGDSAPTTKIVTSESKQSDSGEPVDLMAALQASIDRAKAARRS